MPTIRDKVGHLETLLHALPIDHLDASFIVNHLETMNGGRNSPLQPRRAKQRLYNSFGLNHLRRYGPICDESLPYPVSAPRSEFNKEMTNALHQCDSAFHSID